MTTGLML